MRLRSPLVAVLVTALVVLGGVSPAGAAVVDAGVPSATTSPAGANGAFDDARTQTRVETDNVRLVVTLSENGSARWEVQYWTRLDDENTTRAFDSLQRDVRDNPENYSRQFTERMRSTVATAENTTGREMSASNVSVAAETRGPPQYGVVIYSFRWNGFAPVDGDMIRVGDAIEGVFLDADTRLILRWPSGYHATTVTPEADERRADTVVWRGADTNFVAGEPLAVLAPGAPPRTDAPGDGTNRGSGLLPLALGVLAFGVAGVAAWWYWANRRDGAAVSSGDGDGGLPADAPEPDPELLSNEERVLKFVRDHGGRVKQQEVVREFDWTEARTSQIVRQLRDDDQLEGFRLGRENVLKLPDGTAGSSADGGTDASDHEGGGA